MKYDKILLTSWVLVGCVHGFSPVVPLHGKKSVVSFTLSTSPRVQKQLAATTEDEAEVGREGDWAAFIDEDNTGLVYYFNSKSGASSWEPPSETFPVSILGKEGNWGAYLDEEDTGLVYYFNSKTGESKWEPPTKSFPTVNVPGYSTGKKKGDKPPSKLFSSVFSSPPSKNKKVDSTKNKSDALASEGDWTAYLDKDVDKVYYFNEDTGESLWEPPTETFPSVEVPVSKEPSVSETIAESTSIVEKEEVTATPVSEEDVEEPGKKKSGLFSSMFSSMSIPTSPTKAQTSDTSKIEEKEDKETKKPAVKRKPFYMKSPTVSGPGVTTKTESESTETTPTKKEKAPSPFQNIFSTSINTKPAEKQEELPEVEEQVVEKKKSSNPFSIFSGGVQKTAEEAEEKTPDYIAPPIDKSGKIKIEFASKVLAHPEKVLWGGEDAVFLKGKTFGVFDGVSGAEKISGKPLYSITLANNMKKSLKETANKQRGLTYNELVLALTDAANIADDRATGASTALVASVGEDGFLRAVNLGDCVMIVVRNNQRIVSRTKEISHYFDCPYQLSADSPDRPVDSTQLGVKLQKGDTIVMGSDGVFDNLNDQTLLNCIQENSNTMPKAMFLANSIVALSRKVSYDREADTPYAKLAKRNGYPEYTSGKGGKVDDISVVVGVCT